MDNVCRVDVFKCGENLINKELDVVICQHVFAVDNFVKIRLHEVHYKVATRYKDATKQSCKRTTINGKCGKHSSLSVVLFSHKFPQLRVRTYHQRDRWTPGPPYPPGKLSVNTKEP